MPTIDETLTQVGREQHGLKWERDTFSLTPVWTVDPCIQVIKDICYELLRQPYPRILSDIETKVEFLDEGAFNRVYGVDAIAKVKASSDAQLKTGIVETIQHFKYVFRVSLPVDPRLKSSSEVATIQYLNECTTVPVTTVLHSSQSAKNALGFEWMLQTYVPGHKLSSIWHQLGDAGRERMIEQLAAIQTELFKKTKFRQIGNIYRRRDEQVSGDSAQDNSAKSSPHHFYVGKIVSKPFLLKSAVMEIVNRGPFRTTADWLSAQLENVVLVCEGLQESSDKNDLEAAERSGEIAQRLLALLPKLFPDSGSEEETFLFHEDLSQENIFCREDGTITAILDWEATSCLPLWAAYDFPQLLQGADYPEEPDPTNYRRGADDLLFQDRLLMWQRMKLKGTYMEAMRRIWPEWWGEYMKCKSHAQRDFRNAVDLCESELSWNTITKWLDANDQLQGTDKGEDSGAVIFGHNTKFKLHWKDTGDPEAGEPPLPSAEAENQFHDSGIGTSLGSSATQGGGDLSGSDSQLSPCEEASSSVLLPTSAQSPAAASDEIEHQVASITRGHENRDSFGSRREHPKRPQGWLPFHALRRLLGGG